MRKIILALLLGILLGAGPMAGLVRASSLPEAALQSGVTRNDVEFKFPETATFRLSVDNPVQISSIVLEYGNKQQTCGEVVAKAFPQFKPGTSVNTEWTWEMLQSGSLPPGAQIWWRWRITDVNGKETVTDKQTATWLDSVHNWKTVENGDFLRLHYYQGDQSFINALSQAAADGLKFNDEQSGLKAEAPIDLYIYANTQDMKDAILYEPSWTGGEAFPEQDIVIIGISPDELDWGKDAIVHELTHVLVGHLTFSCLGDVPTWLNEGLAVYSEGRLDPASQKQLNDAIGSDTLLSVRSLSGGFSEVSDKALLSYSQSYSLVKFLIETYGQGKMTALLVALRDGLTIDEALQQTYGFNVDGLEDAWRQAIGARPRAVSAQPTVQPTPTFVPTIVPISGRSGVVAIQATPTAIPTSSSSVQPVEAATAPRGRPPLALTLILLALCCVFLLLGLIFVLAFLVRRQNDKGGSHEQK
ncbi:MAG: peptidase MA family metallohydrolase [Bacteroidota bacterium]